MPFPLGFFTRYKKIKIILLAAILVSGVLACLYISSPSTGILQRPLVDSDEFKNPLPVLPTQVNISTQSAVPIPILMYHYVEHVKDVRDTIRQKLDIYPETLDSQIKTMQQAGYTFLFASDVGEIIDGKKPVPPKPVVLTFDDGYRDFYTDVLPILEKYQVKATSYIITSLIGRPNYMLKDQLDTVEQSGIVELGAHTMHHIDLQHANEAKATAEIVGSKQALEAWYQKPVVSFAYPGGRFNTNTIQIVKDAGFSNAVSTMPGNEVASGVRFVLYRLRPGSRTSKSLLDFLQKVGGRHTVSKAISQPE